MTLSDRLAHLDDRAVSTARRSREPVAPWLLVASILLAGVGVFAFTEGSWTAVPLLLLSGYTGLIGTIALGVALGVRDASRR